MRVNKLTTNVRPDNIPTDNIPTIPKFSLIDLMIAVNNKGNSGISKVVNIEAD